MAVKKKSTKKVTVKKTKLLKFKLKKDYPTSKGLRKEGSYIETSKKGAVILKTQKYI